MPSKLPSEDLKWLYEIIPGFDVLVAYLSSINRNVLARGPMSDLNKYVNCSYVSLLAARMLLSHMQYDAPFPKVTSEVFTMDAFQAKMFKNYRELDQDYESLTHKELIDRLNKLNQGKVELKTQGEQEAEDYNFSLLMIDSAYHSPLGEIGHMYLGIIVRDKDNQYRIVYIDPQHEGVVSKSINDQRTSLFLPVNVTLLHSEKAKKDVKDFINYANQVATNPMLASHEYGMRAYILREGIQNGNACIESQFARLLYDMSAILIENDETLGDLKLALEAVQQSIILEDITLTSLLFKLLKIIDKVNDPNYTHPPSPSSQTATSSWLFSIWSSLKGSMGGAQRFGDPNLIVNFYLEQFLRDIQIMQDQKLKDFFGDYQYDMHKQQWFVPFLNELISSKKSRKDMKDLEGMLKQIKINTVAPHKPG